MRRSWSIILAASITLCIMIIPFTLLIPAAVAAPDERTVVFEWYSFFDVPMIREVWERREFKYSEDHVLSWTYPVVYRTGPEDESASYYTSARLNVTGRNLPEINIDRIGGVETGFLPLYLMNSTSIAVPDGGTINLTNWYHQYVGRSRALNFVPLSWWDGYISELKGTITMDKNATMKVLGITDAEYADFEAWWSTKKNNVKNRWLDWLYDEGGAGGRVDIRPFYDYPFEHAFFNLFFINATADRVILRITVASWGMECILARWFQETFMPGDERWYSDLHLNMTIGPATSDVDLDTAVDWALYMWPKEEVPYADGVWAWEAELGDIPALAKQYNIPTSPAYPYYGKTNSEGVSFDYTPVAWNLQDGETLKFSFKDIDEKGVVWVYTEVEGGPFRNDTGILEPGNMEPFGNTTADYHEKISYDEATKTLTFTGPFDVEAWSNNTWNYYWFKLGGLLPWSCPYIEFNVVPPILIENAFQQPANDNVYPDDKVMVYANVTSRLNGIKQVILNYTTNNDTWFTVNMTNLEGNRYNATIQEFPYNTNVTYVIVAEDNFNNTISTEELGHNYQYHVIPEFPTFIVLPVFMIATLLAVIIYRRKHFTRPRERSNL